MTEFTIHSPHSAPFEVQKLLDNYLYKYGFVPNLHGGLAESPAALQASANCIELLAFWIAHGFSEAFANGIANSDTATALPKALINRVFFMVSNS
jgi:hypothetical protein